MNFLKSRTFWVAVIIFVYNGLNGILSFLPAYGTDIVNALGVILVTYFHINPATTYNLPSDGSSVKTQN